MKRKLCLFYCGLLLLAFSGNSYAQIQIITTLAGNGGVAPGYSGDNGPASAALLHSPTGIGVDATGNIYISDFANHVVRKINTSGIITTFAGTGTSGYTGDAGAATAATLMGPYGIATDAAGDVFIADATADVIRKVTPAGTITTVAGTGSVGFSGDGFAATAAMLNTPYSVATDALGNIYIADYGNDVVRKVNILGTISTVAGTFGPFGYAGDGLAATTAQLSGPTDMAVDGLGNMYIADNGNHVVRKVTPLGIISTYAGNGTSGYSGNGGPATAAELANPYGISVDPAGNVYVADENNNVVRRITPAGIINTFAGAGSFAENGNGSQATGADLASPIDVATDNTGHTYIADFSGNTVRLLTPDNPPIFVNGNLQGFAVCENSGTRAINTDLAITDSDIAQTETWSVAQAAPNGTLAGFPYSTLSTGDTVTPTGLTYAPATNFSGIDSFKISVTDGVAITTTTIYVTVNPTPIVFDPANQSVCNGSFTSAVAFTGTVGAATYNWTNTDTTIGLASSGTGNIPAFRVIDSLVTPVIATITVTPTAMGCVGLPQSFTITANPTPVLNSTLAPAAICNNTTFTYIPTSATPGTVFTWSRGVTTGIGNPAASGTGTISEVLLDTATYPVSTYYVDTLKANGCVNTQNINVIVNPTPMLSNTPTRSSICDNGVFYYVPASATPGTAFTWSRAFVPGIGNPPASGLDTIDEVLTNVTNDSVTLVYVDTLRANGCMNTQTIPVVVYPDPVLSSPVSYMICDSSLFTYIPTSLTPGTTYQWERPFIIGIGDTASSGIDTISEFLTNITTSPLAAVYSYTLTANGCSNKDTVTVLVNPDPVLNSPLTASVCDSAMFNYSFSSASPGVTNTWGRAVVAGVSDSAAYGSGNIHEVLINPGVDPVVVTYIDTLNINGCINIQSVMVSVNPLPVLTSTLTPAAVCSNSLFSYEPTSATSGTTYTWERPAVIGIGDTGTFGADSIHEYLTNVTPDQIPVTYIFTATANGCTGATQDVTVTINPTPALHSSLTEATICNNSTFTYTPLSFTTGTVFTWTRPAVTGIAPVTSSGTGNINEVLTNNSTGVLTAVYVYTLTAYGCANTQDVSVSIAPQLPAPVITTKSPSSVCTNTFFQNFGTATAPPAGTEYTWSVINANISDTGNTEQYILVNFKNAGTAVVIVTAKTAGTTCTSSAADTITVGATDADVPAPVTYFNGSLICLQNNETGYQWGYDDANTLAPTVLTGEINQDYVNGSLTGGVNYWVEVTDNGCTQKTYYNKPANATMKVAGTTTVTVYPNPASSTINVGLSTTVQGAVQAELINTLGQKIATTTLDNNTGTFNVAGLPAGMYLINCYRDGLKISTARVTKN